MNTERSIFGPLAWGGVFTIGLVTYMGVINASCAAVSHSESPKAVNSYMYDQQRQDTPEITFRAGKAASGTLPDRTRFSVQVYESSDGVDVSMRIDRCASEAIAKKKLLKFIKSARLIERGPKTDHQGTVVGQRFVVQFPAKGEYESQAGILWTDKAEIHYLQSSSLRHAKEFEKRFQL
jgi:hypothetical protein